MAARLTHFIVVLAVLVPGLASAEPLADPTRPAFGAEASGGSATPGTAGGPRLQMIKISPAGRSAIIDGQEVTIGSHVGEMRVVKITEGAVVLSGKGDTETVKLFSDVEKRPVAVPGPSKKGSRSTKKNTDASASRKARK